MIKFLAALGIFHQDDLKKRINRITATWQNGCFGKINDHPAHTIPNHHPIAKLMCSQNCWFKSSLLLSASATTFAFSSVFILLLCSVTSMFNAGHGHCLVQCKTAKIVTTKTIPVQVDGEAVRLVRQRRHLKMETIFFSY